MFPSISTSEELLLTQVNKFVIPYPCFIKSSFNLSPNHYFVSPIIILFISYPYFVSYITPPIPRTMKFILTLGEAQSWTLRHCLLLLHSPPSTPMFPILPHFLHWLFYTSHPLSWSPDLHSTCKRVAQYYGGQTYTGLHHVCNDSSLPS